MLFFVTLSYADDAKIVIKQKSGNETVFELSTNPIITFLGEDMVITNDFTSISFPLEDIDSYTADNGTTTPIASTKEKPMFENGRILFNGISKGTPISVYSLDGRLISKQMTDADKAEVPLISLPKGTYIISVENNKIKVINK
jgi:hypothetical protein